MKDTIKRIFRANLVALLVLFSAQILAIGHGLKHCNLNSYRLPRRVAPTHYELFINPNMESMTYTGHVKINLKFLDDPRCESSVDERNELFGCDERQIILNSDERVEILEVSYHDAVGNSSIEIQDTCLDKGKEMLLVQLKQEIKTGSTGQLSVRFSGMIRNGTAGIYKSPYTAENGDKRHYVATNFVAAYARKVFPCFDEPMLRSTFDIIVEHDGHLSAISNMDPVKPPEPKSANDTRWLTRFQRTPSMSTYLLSFGVGEYEQLETIAADGKTLIRVLSPPGQKSRAQPALEAAKQAFDALSEWFQVELPIKKIDLVPYANHILGGLGNWGMITVKDSFLLAQTNPSARSRVFVKILIIHELSHSWFGNLVAPKWWDNMWLNEGLAEFLTFELANELFPHDELNLYYLIDSLTEAMKDELLLAKIHPVHDSSLESAKDIESCFDGITYKKGGAIIRMMSSYLGSELFKKAVHRYLQRCKLLGNADEFDLIQALEEEWANRDMKDAVDIGQSEHPIRDILSSWINQAGYPLLKVKFASSEKNSIQIDQQIMYGLQAIGSDQRWLVPVTMLVSDELGQQQSTLKLIVPDESGSMKIRLPEWFNVSQGHWFKLNHKYEGFYRVNYDLDILNLFQKPIETRLMHPSDRIELADSLIMQCLYNPKGMPPILSMLNWFIDEDNPGVIMLLNYHSDRLFEGKAQPVIELNMRFYERTGGYKASANHGLLFDTTRSLVLLNLVRTDYAPANLGGIKLFDSLSKEEAIPADVFEAVLWAVVKRGSNEQQIRLRQIYNSEESLQLHSPYLDSLLGTPL